MRYNDTGMRNDQLGKKGEEWKQDEMTKWQESLTNRQIVTQEQL